MAQMWSRWRRCLGIAPIVAVLALGACSLPTSPTAQIPSAATVLADIQSANIKDMSFTATGTFEVNLSNLLQQGGTASSTGSSISLNGSATGRITASPQRADIAITAGNSQTAAVEIITDAATQTGYLQIPALDQLLGGGSAQWYAIPLGNSASILNTSIFTNFEQITQAKNIGSTTINGVAVWHLQGKWQDGGASSTEDFYVNQSNSFPVRAVLDGALTTGSTSSNPAGNAQVTINITQVNSGATISLPASGQVIQL